MAGQYFRLPGVSITSTLPTGASTSALQTTGNTSLASIDTKTPALGQALAAASTPVVLTAAQMTTLTPLSTVTANQGSAAAASGAWTAKVTDGTNTSAVKAASTAPAATDPALVVTISPNSADPALGSASGGTAGSKSYATGGVFNTSLPTLTTGQQAAFQLDSSGRQIIAPLASTSTVTAVQATAASLNATVSIAAAQTLATVSTVSSVTSLGNITGTVSLPTGAATSALQTTISGQLPATLGAKTTAASLAVNIASDQASVPTVDVGATSGNSPGSSTVSTVATITAPANATGFILMNLDTSSANIRYRIGGTATTSSGQQLQPARDTGFVPCAANISICAESGTQNYDIQWLVK